jgi:hypothetical protein
MVGLGGLEPPTSPLSGVRSSHLSYRPNVLAGNTLTRSLNALQISSEVRFSDDTRKTTTSSHATLFILASTRKSA